MSEITNPAMLALAQAKHRNTEALEDSRRTLEQWQRDVAKAAAVLEEKSAALENRRQEHHRLQQEHRELTKAEGILAAAIKEEGA